MHGLLNGTDLVETPVTVGNVARDLMLQGGVRTKVGEERFGVGFVAVLIFRRDMDAAGGETVFERVVGGAGAAFN